MLSLCTVAVLYGVEVFLVQSLQGAGTVNSF